jgi:hypothetical protein
MHSIQPAMPSCAFRLAKPFGVLLDRWNYLKTTSGPYLIPPNAFVVVDKGIFLPT